MVMWRGRPDSGPDSAILATFRVTRRQALGRRGGRAVVVAALSVPLLVVASGRLAAAGVVACLVAAVVLLVRSVPAAPVEVDDRGVRPVPGVLPRIGWEEVVDVYAERYGRLTVAALRLDSGASVQLPLPYDGCLLGHDPGFEDKLFILRQLWEIHRRWPRA